MSQISPRAQSRYLAPGAGTPSYATACDRYMNYIRLHRECLYGKDQLKTLIKIV